MDTKLMRALLLLIIIGGAAAWYFYPQLQARHAPSKAVYQWQDEQGKVHYGDAPPVPGAQAKQLQPLNTVKGMPLEQARTILKPKPVQPCQNKDEDEVPSAACLRAQQAPRNLAIERIESAVSQ